MNRSRPLTFTLWSALIGPTRLSSAFVGVATPVPDPNPTPSQRSLNTGSSTFDTMTCGQTRSNCRRSDTTNYPIHGSGQDDFLQLPTLHRPLRDRWCSSYEAISFLVFQTLGVLVSTKLIQPAFLLAGVLSFILPGSSAAEEDNFEGAVWKFEMSNKNDSSRVLVGNFRVSSHILFQKATPSDPTYSKKVGTNKPNGTKTRFEVADFRAFTKKKKVEFLIKGTGRVSLVEFGEWKGLFTDGRGVNWAIRLSRIKE